MMKKYSILLLFILGSLFPVYGQTCDAPTTLSVTNVTGTTATISWLYSGPATTWEVLINPAGSPAPTASTSGMVTNVNPHIITGLTPCTTYDVYVRTVCDPTAKSSWSAPVSFGQSSTISAAAVVASGITCTGGADGSVIMNATGGSGNYTYSIAAPITTAPQASNVFSGLPSGSYIFQVMDMVSGCSATTVVTITQPNPLILSLSVSNNTITASVTGGAPPYIFTLVSLSNGTAPVTQSSNVFTGLEQGWYDLTVRDSLGCIVTTHNVTISVVNLNVQDQYIDFNGDGFTSLGDVIDYQISVANSGTLAMTNVVVASSNTTVFGSPIATLNAGATDSTTYTARHVITQNDINNGRVNANFNVTADYNNSTTGSQISKETILNSSNGIRMNAFVDANNNGTQEAGEANVDAGTFNYQVNGGTITSVSSQTGRYTIYESNPSSVYNVTYNIRPELLPRYSIATANYTNVTVPANSGITTLNFALTELPHTDLSVSLFPLGTPPRPGFTYKNQIAYKNNGNATIANGVLTFTHGSAVTVINVSQSGIVSNANGFTYTFTNLLPNQTRYITVEMQVPTIPTVGLGQVITNNVTATGVAGDMNVQNDNSSLSQLVVGAYDPNDKTESHGGKIVHSEFTSNDYLNYTIRFENTGTYEAVNVRVNDILDSKLDESTIVTVNASHPYVLERKNNVLNWKFDAIQLPPSVVNTNIGHGYINFKIKPKPGYVVGDIIPNTASIYFDFNPAIVTNTYTTEFVNSLSTDVFEGSTFTLYPNPASSFITIATKGNASTIERLNVIDLTGKTVITKAVNDATTVIDLSSLANGMYFVRLQSGDQEKTLKIIKE